MLSRPFLVAAATAAVALPSIAYLLFSRRLDLLSLRGIELRSKRARPLTNEIGLVILGWGSPTCTYAEVRETLCSIREHQHNEVKFTFEIYLKSSKGDAAKHSSLNLFTISPPVTMHIAICFPADELVSESKMLQLGDTIKAALAKTQQRVAMYLVERSVYTEYGEYDGPAQLEWNPKQTRKDWALDEKSPYIIAHTAIPKPARFAHKSNLEWSRENWFPKQSPMSEMMQPRARYVRNVVISTDDVEAPPFGGIIIEAWPSKRHMHNSFLFFHANNLFEVALHILVMVGNVMQFADLTVLQGSILEEWLE